VLGPALGGLLGDLDPRLPFWVAAGMTLLNAMYGLFVLPESLPGNLRRKFEWRRANPLGSLKLLRSHHELIGLASVNFLYFLAHQVLPSVFVLYAGHRYGWDAKAVGLTLAGVGVCNIAIQAGLVKPALRRLGERRLVLTGLFFGAAGFAVYGLANSGTSFLLAVPVFALIGFYGPAAQQIMTRRVGPSEQGELQGANSSVMGIAGLLGPGLFTLTFAYFIRPTTAWKIPGAPFLLAALLMVVAMAVAWRVTKQGGRVRQGEGG
jgi:DHA1 family tetracycline resistance protein-like MFS transporter